MLLTDLPLEVVLQITDFLIDDGVSIGRLGYSCRSLRSMLLLLEESSSTTSSNDNNVTVDERIWKRLCYYRWKHWVAMKDDDPGAEEAGGERPSFFETYQRRHLLDRQAMQLLSKMAVDIRRELMDLNDGHTTSMDGSIVVGHVWSDRANWSFCLQHRIEIMDVLRSKALKQQPQSTENEEASADTMIAKAFNTKLEQFLACVNFYNLHFVNLLHEYNSILLKAHDNPEASEQPIILEEFAALITSAQQTPIELLESSTSSKEQISEKLDQMAESVQCRLHNNMSLREKIEIINQHLFFPENPDEAFAGNEADYYNYRNSLLDHVFKSKKGIPITLSILYCCLCRRLGISTYLVGLPGHVVLGVKSELDDDSETVMYLDVFRKGNILTLADCQSIAASYGYDWNPRFVEPLKVTDVVHRMLNNLGACHNQQAQRQQADRDPFHKLLLFRQLTLTLLHRKSEESINIVSLLLEPISKEVKLVFEPDLLRHYGLLTEVAASP